MDKWPLPHSLLRALRLSSGKEVTLRLDALEFALADEANRFFASLPDEPWARYLSDEGRSSTEAFQRGTHAALQDDSLAALVFGRLVLESAIRMLWLGADVGDEQATKVRLGRLQKRDLSQLLKASDAMASMSKAAPLVTDAEHLKEIAKETLEKVAPEPKEMAQEAGADPLYAAYRYFATASHPGIAARAGIFALIEADELLVMLRFAYSVTVTAMGAIASTLFGNAVAEDLKMNVQVMSRGGTLQDES